MFNFFLILLTLSSWSPVLNNGRYQPYATLPQNEQNEEKLRKEGRLLENFEEVTGKPYREAHGKALYYPTKWQLQAELFLHRFPTKWILIGLYLLSPPTAFGLHTVALTTTCYILQRPPVSNMAETLFYVPWTCALCGLLFKQKREGGAMAAILLLFLPGTFHFQNVQAVLDSQYWLIVHVLMVVGSYGIFFFAALLGHLYLLKIIKGVETILLRSLYIGTALLIGGTILGGVWAAQSWGRFWDWDPKEAWAFISSGLYLIIIHAYRFKKLSAKGLALGSIFGLMAITFTWYGVNYILATGLHSYGFGSGGALYYYLYLGAEALFLSLIYFLKKRHEPHSSK